MQLVYINFTLRWFCSLDCICVYVLYDINIVWFDFPRLTMNSNYATSESKYMYYIFEKIFTVIQYATFTRHSSKHCL